MRASWKHIHCLSIAALLWSVVSSTARNGDCPPRSIPEPPAIVFGLSVQCRPIVGYEVGDGKETIIVFGAFHGHERMTAPFVERFYRDILSAPGALKANRKVVVVPMLNPDGWEANTRINANGVDINRNFPTKNWKAEAVHATFPPGPFPGSEPETRAVLRLIDTYRPRLIVSVHQPLNLINYDGPARHLARTLGKFNGMRVKRYIGYSTPGSLGTFAGKERRIPTITLELPPSDSTEDYFADTAKGLMAIINH